MCANLNFGILTSGKAPPQDNLKAHKDVQLSFPYQSN
jgi:hypothetical protein